MKPLDDMTEPELRRFLSGIAKMIQNRLPPGELFCLITFGAKQIGQYICNAQRHGVIKALREFADRLEKHEDVPR